MLIVPVTIVMKLTSDFYDVLPETQLLKLEYNACSASLSFDALFHLHLCKCWEMFLLSHFVVHLIKPAYLNEKQAEEVKCRYIC